MSEPVGLWRFATVFSKDCIAVFSGPKEFFEKAALVRPRADDLAIGFAVFSLLLFSACVVVWAKSLGMALGIAALVALDVWLAIFSVSFWFVTAFCWRIMGGTASIESHIVIGAYVVGGMFVICSASMLLLAFPMRELFYAAFAAGATEVHVNFSDLNGIDRIYAAWMFFIIMANVVGVLVFLTQAWGGYRQINQATPETSKKALMLTMIVNGVVTGFISSIVGKVAAFF